MKGGHTENNNISDDNLINQNDVPYTAIIGVTWSVKHKNINIKPQVHIQIFILTANNSRIFIKQFVLRKIFKQRKEDLGYN